MGSKIITEDDFWMCSGGAIPAQLQGFRDGVRSENGSKYITVADTATCTCIDFGCTHYMLLAALVVAALAVIAALIVSTGGMALIIVGLVAGAAGAALTGVVGALICGQKMRALRTWSGSKSNLNLQGGNAITGNNIMTCPAGGTITFAPNIHSWGQAIAIAGLKYTTIVVEGAFIGAGVGIAIGVLAAWFGPAAIAAKGLVIIMPTGATIAANVGIMAGTKYLAGMSNVADNWALDRIHSNDDAWKAFSPEYEAATRIYSGGPVTLSDIFLFATDILLPFLHVRAALPAVGTPPATSPRLPEPPRSPEPEAVRPEAVRPETVPPEPEVLPPEPGQNGKAYEDPIEFEVDPRYTEFSTNPKTGKLSVKAIREAQAILQAEAEGIVRNPTRPVEGDPDLDFRIDGPEPYRWCDTKTPVEPRLRDPARQASDIGENIRAQKGRPPSDVLHVVDLRNIPAADRAAFQQGVINAAGSSDGIVFINQ